MGVCDNRPATYHACVVIFLSAFSFAIGISATPNVEIGFFHPTGNQVLLTAPFTILPHSWLLFGWQCPALEAQTVECRHAMSRVSATHGIVSLLSSVVACFLAPVFGSLSDIHGRQPVLLVTLVLHILPHIAIFAHVAFGVSLYLYYVLVVVTGGGFLSLVMVMSYVGDLTNEEEKAARHRSEEAVTAASNGVDVKGGETAIRPVTPRSPGGSRVSAKRTNHFGFVLSSLSVAMIMGAPIGSVLSDVHCFEIANASLLLAIVFTAVVVPESLPEQLQTKASISFVEMSLFNAALSWVESLRLLFGNAILSRLAWIVSLQSFVAMGIRAILYLEMKDRFGMSSATNAYIAGTFGVSEVVLMTLILPMLTRCLSERQIYCLGCFFTMLTPLMLAVMWTEWLIYPVQAFAAGAVLSFPAVSAVIARRYEQQLGTLQGALFGARALAGGFGPLVNGALFALFVKVPRLTDDAAFYYPAIPFIMDAALGLIALLIALSVPAAVSRDQDSLGGADTTRMAATNAIASSISSASGAVIALPPLPTSAAPPITSPEEARPLLGKSRAEPVTSS